ncbi:MULTISPECIES: VanZ family protein [unclassified Streptomyces]|uniref:VanZ family protein n=1 Tax=unclassified Streptomyces TaxID=2593676 RepID=UPI0016602FD6|nr:MULTISPECIES: VanZ family protein [unclassified Streptomyces]
MFVLLAVLLAGAVGALRFRSAQTRETERPALHALLAAAVTAVVSLTLWSTGSPVDQTRSCVVNRDLIEPFTTSQGLLNAGLFVPVGLLGVLATRNIAGTLIGGALLTLTIETLQGSLTFLGRGCDTSDLQMNSLGVAAGVLLGWLTVKLDHPGSPPFWTWGNRKLAAIWAISTVALGSTWIAFIHPEVVAYTVAIGHANGEQQSSARAAVTAAFEDHFTINDIQFARGVEGGSGTVIVSFNEGFAELSWPDKSTFTAALDMSDGPQSTGYPVSAHSEPPTTADQARALASSYAEAHAPWGLTGSKSITTPVGMNAEMGWMTSWRRHNKDGVMMPMRLDIQIDRNGALTQLIQRKAEDPPLPAPSVSRNEAIQKFHQAFQEGDSKGKVESELIAKSVDGIWKIHWLVVGASRNESGFAIIDATSGEVISRTSQPTGTSPGEIMREAQR